MRGCTARASACSRLPATRPLAGVETGGRTKGRFRTAGSLRVGPQVRIRLAPPASPKRTRYMVAAPAANAAHANPSSGPYHFWKIRVAPGTVQRVKATRIQSVAEMDYRHTTARPLRPRAAFEAASQRA